MVVSHSFLVPVFLPSLIYGLMVVPVVVAVMVIVVVVFVVIVVVVTVVVVGGCVSGFVRFSAMIFVSAFVVSH